MIKLLPNRPLNSGPIFAADLDAAMACAASPNMISTGSSVSASERVPL